MQQSTLDKMNRLAAIHAQIKALEAEAESIMSPTTVIPVEEKKQPIRRVHYPKTVRQMTLEALTDTQDHPLTINTILNRIKEMENVSVLPQTISGCLSTLKSERVATNEGGKWGLIQKQKQEQTLPMPEQTAII